MNSRRPHHSRHAGSTVVIALVVVAAATVGFASWVGLMAQRGRSIELQRHSGARRIAYHNARLTAREYALERAITATADSNGFAHDPASGWGSSSIPAWTGFPMETSSRPGGLNGFSLSWDYPYAAEHNVTAGFPALAYSTSVGGAVSQTTPAASTYFKTFIRSRSPILGGDLLIVNRSSLTPPVVPSVTGNIAVNGRVLHFVPEVAAADYQARSVRFASPHIPGNMNIRPLNLAGTDLIPSNLAWTPVTFGRIGGVTDYSGRLSVIDDAANGGNSLRQRLTTAITTSGNTAYNDPGGVANDGAGNVTITPCIGPTSPADLPSVIITNEVTELIIDGQDGTNLTSYAPFRPALAVVYIQDPSSVRKLTTIRLRKQGARRMLLAIKQSGTSAGSPVNVVVEDTNAICEWNMVIIAENTPLVFSATGGASTIRLVGGVQTNAPLTGPAAPTLLSLNLLTDTRGLIRLTPRAAWVETLMPDRIPGTTNANTW